MTEIFVPIKGYEGLYKISNLGNVVSCEKRKGRGYKQIQPEKIKKQRTNSCGYLIVQLCKNGIFKTLITHRLTAFHFVDNPDNLPEVNHKDGNKLNPISTNLEWNTRKQNERHAYETGLKKTGAMWGNSKAVFQYSLSGLLIKEWDCISDIVRAFGYHKRLISNCCQGKRNSYKGFVWKFI